MADSRHLSFEKLKQLLKLDLTDRRLRQIADLGYFPKPDNGLYDWVATVQGLIKFYREKHEDLASRKKAIEDEKHRRLKRDNDRDEGLLIPKAEVVARFRLTVDPTKQILRQKLENEYPQAVAGMDVPQARVFGKRLGDSILVEFQKLYAAFGI